MSMEASRSVGSPLPFLVAAVTEGSGLTVQAPLCHIIMTEGSALTVQALRVSE